MRGASGSVTIPYRPVTEEPRSPDLVSSLRGERALPHVSGDLPCTHCGFNLRGLGMAAACPECATPVRLSLPGSTGGGDDPSVVGSDRPCVNCGYNLNGLPIDGRCPECATPVPRSIQGYYLVYASRWYLRVLQRGLLLVIVGNLLWACSQAAVMFFSKPYAEMLWGCVSVAVMVLLGVGYWWFSAVDPAMGEGEAARSPRRVLRALLVVHLTLLGILAAGRFAGVGLWRPFLPRGGFSVVWWAALGVQGVQFFYVIAHAKWLCRRIPSRYLESQAETYMWVLPLVAVVGLLVLVGPVVAWVLYLVFLNALRHRIGMILRVAPAGDSVV